MFPAVPVTVVPIQRAATPNVICGVYSRVILRLHAKVIPYTIRSSHVLHLSRSRMSTFNDELDGRQEQIASTAFSQSGIFSGGN
jgi:hypothetical protein